MAGLKFHQPPATVIARINRQTTTQPASRTLRLISARSNADTHDTQTNQNKIVSNSIPNAREQQPPHHDAAIQGGNGDACKNICTSLGRTSPAEPRKT